jgi:hypothetical protein
MATDAASLRWPGHLRCPQDLQVEGLQGRRARSIQDDDARHRRVHSPVPHPCPAARLPPHPPLRPARQAFLRRQHRPRPRAACRAEASKHCRRRPDSRAIPHGHASLPLLWRPNDHRRDFPTRLRTTRSSHHTTSRDQDRHVMTTLQRCSAARLFAGSPPATAALAQITRHSSIAPLTPPLAQPEQLINSTMTHHPDSQQRQPTPLSHTTPADTSVKST